MFAEIHFIELSILYSMVEAFKPLEAVDTMVQSHAIIFHFFLNDTRN